MRCKHGCVIVKNGKIIARGYNKYMGYNKYGTGLKDQRRTIHADSDAINNINNRNKLKDADLYVVRYNIHTGSASYSEPCHICKQIISSCMTRYGLRNAYYSVNVEIAIKAEQD